MTLFVNKISEDIINKGPQYEIILDLGQALNLMNGLLTKEDRTDMEKTR